MMGAGWLMIRAIAIRSQSVLKLCLTQCRIARKQDVGKPPTESGRHAVQERVGRFTGKWPCLGAGTPRKIYTGRLLGSNLPEPRLYLADEPQESPKDTLAA